MLLCRGAIVLRQPSSLALEVPARAVLEPWSARRVSGRRAPASSPVSRVETGVDNAGVGAWAASSGIELSARGRRLSKDVIEQYGAAGD